MTQRATTIAEAYRACNPDQPLPPNDERYVDLAGSRSLRQVVGTITRNIARSEEDAQLKILFTGHRGAGKTTELLRLQHTLSDKQFFTIYMDIEELLSVDDLEHLDVLVVIAKQVQAGLDEQGMPLPEVLLNSIAQWFQERIIEETTSCEIQGSINTKAKAGSSRCETIRRNLSRELSVFMDRLNRLIATARNTVQDNGFRDIVLIVDGIEKMQYQLNPDGISNHTALFIRHAEQLRTPQCHIIYTVPISLAYNENLGADFDDIHILPMVRTDSGGIARLVELVERRVDTERVFSESALLERLVQASGGVVRDLMRLVRLATDTDADTITAADVDYALKTLRNEYDRLIRSNDIPIFRHIQQERRISGDEAEARLLHLRLVLEYQNGARWADLHPVVRQIPWVKAALAADTDNIDDDDDGA